MKPWLFVFILCAIFSSCQSSMKNSNDGKKDYLHVPGPITLIEKKYYLGWTSHPADNYYKQEYFPAGQDPEHYTEMILVELALGDLNMQDIAVAKAKEINNRKTTDPIANYNLGQNKNNAEVLLDFIQSQGSSADSTIAEWNLYRYKAYADEKGRKGILLFGWSRRSYGPAYQAFADELKNNRKQYVIPIVDLPYPKVMLDK